MIGIVLFGVAAVISLFMYYHTGAEVCMFLAKLFGVMLLLAIGLEVVQVLVATVNASFDKMLDDLLTGF